MIAELFCYCQKEIADFLVLDRKIITPQSVLHFKSPSFAYVRLKVDLFIVNFISYTNFCCL